MCAKRMMRCGSSLITLLVLGVATMGLSVCAAGKVCNSCGSQLAADALYCHICGAPVSADSIFCWRCGLRLPLDAQYCTRCGSGVCRVGDDVVPPPPPSVSPPLPQATEQPEVPLGAPDAAGAADDSAKAKKTVFPPRLFDSPSGTILPSRVLHVGSGWIFGFSDDEGAHRWALSFGLGGLGEALITSSRILHHTDAETHALAGFRMRLPVGIVSGGLENTLGLALNIAATDENDFHNKQAFAASDGVTLHSLSYKYRETTVGLAGTWHGIKTRVHAILHVTDLRAENIHYYATAPEDVNTGPDQKEVYTSFGVGIDHMARSNTLLLAELRTAPQVSFRAAGAQLTVEHRLEGAAGVRFFPDPHFGLDAVISADEESSGLADLGIGFGLHLMLGPGL